MPKDPRAPAEKLVIRNVEFIGGMAEKHGWRPESTLPEIAFAGRSNVGKSSLLNTLVRRKSFARVSRTPGRTREINFFRVNNGFVLVDLPGYGYARVSKERRAEWRPLLERYLGQTRQLRGIVLLLDIRRDPSEDDQAIDSGFVSCPPGTAGKQPAGDCRGQSTHRWQTSRSVVRVVLRSSARRSL